MEFDLNDWRVDEVRKKIVFVAVGWEVTFIYKKRDFHKIVHEMIVVGKHFESEMSLPTWNSQREIREILPLIPGWVISRTVCPILGVYCLEVEFSGSGKGCHVRFMVTPTELRMLGEKLKEEYRLDTEDLT